MKHFIYIILATFILLSFLDLAAKAEVVRPTKEEFMEAAEYVAEEYFGTLHMLEYCLAHRAGYKHEDALKLYERINKPIMDDLSEAFLIYLKDKGYIYATKQNYYGFLGDASQTKFEEMKRQSFAYDEGRERFARLCNGTGMSIGEEPFTEFRALKGSTRIMEEYFANVYQEAE